MGSAVQLTLLVPEKKVSNINDDTHGLSILPSVSTGKRWNEDQTNNNISTEMNEQTKNKVSPSNRHSPENGLPLSVLSVSDQIRSNLTGEIRVGILPHE